MCESRSRAVLALTTILGMIAAVQVLAAPAASGQAFVPISGSGSTWSQNALDQWRRTVNQFGLTVQYAGSGSTAGRNDFRNGSVDFAMSEIEYGLTDGGVVDAAPTDRGFTYLPIVAGGTAIAYNLRIDGDRVRNLRLSGETIARIFSRQITDWSDAAIAADNPGLTLPPRPIVPVVRSDGSGSSAQFTRWLAAEHGPIWDSYCGRADCGFTSNFPTRSGVEAKAGSQGVAGFVAQQSSEGTITYVEYSYARNAELPVAKVLNEAGYYVEPTAPNVAVALTAAVTKPDLTQDLQPVYDNPDPRSYPLSGTSYLIVPTDTRQNFTEDKGRTLSEFASYAVCEGQQQADQLGYSPLPINLVAASVDQIARIPGTTNKLNAANLAGCGNPTVAPDGSNLLVTTAPQPQECDRQGPTQCGDAAVPTPSPSPAVTPSPSPVPTVDPTPTPTARPSTTPQPVRPIVRDWARRAVAEALAAVFGVDPARGLSPRAQLRRVLASIFSAGRSFRPVQFGSGGSR